MIDYIALLSASRVCIRSGAGYIYVYVQDATGKSMCYTIAGDVKVTRGNIEVVTRIECVEHDVNFPSVT